MLFVSLCILVSAIISLLLLFSSALLFLLGDGIIRPPVLATRVRLQQNKVNG